MVSDSNSTESRYIFIIHGRNHKAKEALSSFLTTLDLKPLEWEQVVSHLKTGTPTTLDVVRKGLELAGAVIVLMTPDDFAYLDPSFINDHDSSYEKDGCGQARQNVILEAGMALAIKQDKTIIVKMGKIRDMSDIDGINYISINNDKSSRKRFVERLKTVSSHVDDSGEKWLSAGDFDAAFSTTSPNIKKKLSSNEGIETLKTTLSTLYFQWQSAKGDDSLDHSDNDSGKFILQKLNSALAGHKLDIDKISSLEQQKELIEVGQNVNQLKNWSFYADGGESTRNFWKYGEEQFNWIQNIIASYEAK